MDFQKDYQYHFERMFQDSFMIQYLLQPLILFLIIILIYVFIKKKLLRDEKEDLESLKLLQELLDSGTINDNEFQKKKNRITSKWWYCEKPSETPTNPPHFNPSSFFPSVWSIRKTWNNHNSCFFSWWCLWSQETDTSEYSWGWTKNTFPSDSSTEIWRSSGKAKWIGTQFLMECYTIKD